VKFRWLAGALLFVGPALLGSPITFQSPRANEPLVAGSVVTIAWDGVPADADEMEILLSLDGGRSVVRIGKEADPEIHSWTWRVPNLPTGRAVFLLRFGRGGSEIVAGSSASFAIEPSPVTPLPEMSSRNGEVWVTQGTTGDPLPGLACGLPIPSIVAGPTGFALWTGGGGSRLDRPSDTGRTPAGVPSPPLASRIAFAGLAGAAPLPLRI